MQGTGDWVITIMNSWASSIGASYETTLTFDGLCEGAAGVPGCTDSAACNYDSTATNDDGSCEFTSCVCPGDLDGDGQVAVTDVLLFLSDFGCAVDPCVGDSNGDGQTNVEDLLLMLSYFGLICE